MDDFDLLLKSAKGGDAEAQFQVAYAYEMGDGVAKNYKKAMHWYKLAAKQNHVKAQLSMGYFYHSGMGVSEDYEEAIEWYKLAADQGCLLYTSDAADD